MRNRGVRHPKRGMIVCGIVGLGGALAVAAGAYEMNALGHETGRTAGLIGLGLFAAIIGAALFVNYLWASRIFAAMRSGRTAIARWTVPPDQWARFREVDRRFAERGSDNDYRSPAAVPASGVEVIFSDDGVLIGDCFFGLATTGLSRFRAVDFIESDPPMIEFGTAMTAASNIGHLRVRTIDGVLRVPVAREAELQGRKVAERYRDIVSRRVIVKPHFWTARISAGLAISAVSAVLAGIGFALADRNQELGNAPLGLAVVGTVCGVAGLVIAGLGWALRQRQHHG